MSARRLHVPAIVVLTLPLLGVSACQHAQSLISSSVTECGSSDKIPERVRFASYNIKAGLESSLEEVGDVIQEMAPDVIALQEVDKGTRRAGMQEQAAYLARRLGFEYAFASAMEREGGEYGVALLSRFPFKRVDRIPLFARFAMEPRVAIDADLCIGSRSLRFVALHSDVLPWSATDNIRSVLRRVRSHLGQGVIVAGDFNSLPSWEGPQELKRAGLLDLLGELAEGATFIGDPLKRRVDYIFADDALSGRVIDAGIGSRVASDHLPVFADFDLRAD